MRIYLGIIAAEFGASLSVQNAERKKDWVISPAAFQRLLEWFDQGVKSDGQSYLDMRLRLVSYFDRKNCRTPDELADETLNRVARRLVEEGAIVSETPARYCYIVARFVFLEYLRETNHDVPLDEAIGNRTGSPETDDESLNREALLRCLDQCTVKLETAQRDLIFRYYQGEQGVKIKNRLALAQQLGITVNALSIRACRIRDKLEACVRACTSGQ